MCIFPLKITRFVFLLLKIKDAKRLTDATMDMVKASRQRLVAKINKRYVGLGPIGDPFPLWVPIRPISESRASTCDSTD